MTFSDYNIAAGYTDGIIHLLGGQDHRRQLYLFRISNQSMTSLTSTKIDYDIGKTANNNYYTQINSCLYLLDVKLHNRILIYDLQQRAISSNITMNLHVTAEACITSSTIDELLFISGGSATNYTDLVQILNISSNEWLTNIPSLLTGRREHSCVFNTVQNELWIIGGTTGDSQDTLNSVETLSMNNITQFEYSKNLKIKTYQTMASFIDVTNSILVLGGYNIQDLQIINCTNGETVIGGYLSIGVRRGAGILVNHIQYLFGGRTSSITYLNKMQYLDLNDLYINNTIIQTSLPTIYNISDNKLIIQMKRRLTRRRSALFLILNNISTLFLCNT
eukprot:512655_1